MQLFEIGGAGSQLSRAAAAALSAAERQQQQQNLVAIIHEQQQQAVAATQQQQQQQQFSSSNGAGAHRSTQQQVQKVAATQPVETAERAMADVPMEAGEEGKSMPAVLRQMPGMDSILEQEGQLEQQLNVQHQLPAAIIEVCLFLH
jgi:hypothetical protein